MKISIPLAVESNPSKRYQQSGNSKTKTMFSVDLVIRDIYVSDVYFLK